jgi:predicted phage baseplate assembly protein
MNHATINLDDRDFQSLVDEARQRITTSCPDWDEHNVSDPGITLIELFAWMTDLLIYRVNRIPEKVQRAMLDLLGVVPEGPAAATTDLRFRLTDPAKKRLELRAHEVEVATAANQASKAVVFRLSEDVAIPALKLGAMVLARAGKFAEVPVGAGVALPAGSLQAAFATPPVTDDALYLGFASPLARLVVAVSVKARRARGTGVEPSDPPWIWEVSGGNGEWPPAAVLRDETGGFNYGSGTIELQVPDAGGLESVAGKRMHWLRCRPVVTDPVDPKRPGYTHPPSLEEVRAGAVGVLAPAEHATAVDDELLGYSDGTPGQAFALRHDSALALDDDALEVHEPGPKVETWQQKKTKVETWQQQESFARSGPLDAHFCFDPASGEVQLGPMIRAADGWEQRGKIPPAGSALCVRRYHYGGGVAGNVPAGALTVLRRPLPGVASVTNPLPARHGVDAESVESLCRRAPIEIRTRYRAVTAGDFEILACQASPQVARARCIEDETSGEIRLGLLPTVSEPAGPLSIDKLQPSDALRRKVAEELDKRRLLGTHVHVEPMGFCGATVVAEVEVEPAADPETVRKLVVAALHRYLSPYVGGELTTEGDGWEYGRAVRVSELEVVVRRVPGVLLVTMLRLYATDIDIDSGKLKPAPQPVAGQLPLGPQQLVASGTHLVRPQALKPA